MLVNILCAKLIILTFNIQISNSHQEIVGCDRHHACEDVDMLEKDLNLLKKEKEDLLIQIRELNKRPDLSHDFEVSFPFSTRIIFIRNLVNNHH